MDRLERRILLLRELQAEWMKVVVELATLLWSGASSGEDELVPFALRPETDEAKFVRLALRLAKEGPPWGISAFTCDYIRTHCEGSSQSTHPACSRPATEFRQLPARLQRAFIDGWNEVYGQLAELRGRPLSARKEEDLVRQFFRRASERVHGELAAMQRALPTLEELSRRVDHELTGRAGLLPGLLPRHDQFVLQMLENHVLKDQCWGFSSDPYDESTWGLCSED